jgi:hypothetical protein
MDCLTLKMKTQRSVESREIFRIRHVVKLQKFRTFKSVLSLMRFVLNCVCMFVVLNCVCMFVVLNCVCMFVVLNCVCMFVVTLIHIALILSPYLQPLVDFLCVTPCSFRKFTPTRSFLHLICATSLIFLLFLTAHVAFSYYKMQFSIIFKSISMFSEVTVPPACNLRIVRIVSPSVLHWIIAWKKHTTFEVPHYVTISIFSYLPFCRPEPNR